MAQLERYARDLKARADRLEVPISIAERFEQYRPDPVRFVREVLHATPESYQVEILNACTEHPRLAWRAAHGVGKTALLSWILLWWLLTRPFSRVLVLAPAMERQVGRYLLPEVRLWARKAKEPLPITVRTHTVEVRGYPREWFALAIQATDATKVEGAHAEHLCILADEAKGLSADVVAALHGTQTDVEGDRLYLLASLPGGNSGPFYDTFRKGAELWRLFHTKAADSSLVSDKWIEERKLEWGETNPLFVARVLGDFPSQDDTHLFGLTDLEAATEKVLEQPENVPVTLGVDVARFGSDLSAIAVWQGGELVGVETRQGLDTMSVASWVSVEINRRQPIKSVRVDVVGIGSGVADRLRQLGHSQIVDVHAGGAARKPELYLNKRAELYFELKQALERGEVKLPNDETLLAELAAQEFTYDVRGKLKLVEKSEIKRNLGASPDRADAAVLGFGKVRRGATNTDGISFISVLRENPWGYDNAPEGTPESFISPPQLEGLAERITRYRGEWREV